MKTNGRWWLYDVRPALFPTALSLWTHNCPYLSFASILLHFLSLFVFFLHPLLLSLPLVPSFSPSRLPDESRGDSPPGEEEEMGKDIFIIPSFFLLSFKRVTLLSSTRTKLHLQYAKFTMFAENWNPLGCWNQQTSVTPILLQRKCFLNLEKQPILCDCKRNWIW